MYKIIMILIAILLTQCKSNEAVKNISEESTNTNSGTDTTIVESKYVYRGDTMLVFTTMVGDTIINKTISKYSNGGGDGEAVMMAEHRRSIDYSSDAVMMSKSAEAPSRATDASGMPSSVSKDRTRPDVPQNPDAGQLTAGEWNDLNNWEDWTALLSDQNYSEMQNHWGIYPTERYSVFIRNDKNIPLNDVKVDLLSGDKVVWSARTDNSGKAELWLGFDNKKEEMKNALRAKVYREGQVYELSVEKGKSVNLVIDNSCNLTNNVDIMFVVDATGSMGDEITYLKSEVKDVINRSVKNGRDLNLRIGSVFYRDSRDTYLTKTSPLSNSHDWVYDFIDKQSAGGGGDYPEAVEAALEEALVQEWSDEAVTRIVFLILDAPPHDEAQVKSTIRDQIREAAERGIKIIPISSSGINRETEFLLKFMSIATNGTYVFITDDSGIGNPHLAPLVDDYEVETLNDLMTRLVSHYTQVAPCNVEIQENVNIKVYPNPTSNYINIETDISFKEIRIVSNSGMIVQRVKAHKGVNRIDLSQLVDGVYTVQCLGSDTQYSRPIIVVSDK